MYSCAPEGLARAAIESFHHLNDPSDSNAICVLEGKEEMEANEYTHFVNYDFRLFILEKKDGAKIGCARLHKWEDRLDIGCYIIPSGARQIISFVCRRKRVS